MSLKPNIAVIGAGYVGLTSSACFAELGYNVICIEKDQEKIKKLKTGETLIYEPSLGQLIKRNLENKRLVFSEELVKAVISSDILFITVGTPTTENREADVSALEYIIQSIAYHLHHYKIIVVKSTVQVGTSRRLANMIYNINNKAKFDIVANPEFLRAGSAVKDFMHPDRIILGLEGKKTYNIMTQLYQTFIDKKVPIIIATLEEAELIKYAANCFLAMKIGFANEMAYLCEHLGTEVKTVLFGMGLDKRIGNDYLQPGPGIGGSCLSKDALVLTSIAQTKNASLSIVEAVLKSNSQHKDRIVKKIISACNGSVAGKRLAILGIAFKANTDDIRESPALTLISQLQVEGAVLNLYDPVVKQLPFLRNINMGVTIEDTIKNTDAIIILTEWEEFRNLNLAKMKNHLRNHIIPATLIDLRNLFIPELALAAGFRYFCLGRNCSNTQTIVS